MGENAATLVTAFITLTLFGVLLYWGVRNLWRSLRNVKDAIDEEVGRRRN